MLSLRGKVAAHNKGLVLYLYDFFIYIWSPAFIVDFHRNIGQMAAYV